MENMRHNSDVRSLTFGDSRDVRRCQQKKGCGPAEEEIAVLRQIAAVESSCTARLNYKLPQQILLAKFDGHSTLKPSVLKEIALGLDHSCQTSRGLLLHLEWTQSTRREHLP
ncbi:hypothetical protein JOB18_012542 [Solea senegalensis]|uniref:Uncharacterized protein n=1 Tax=Solea senegalensis TaxID=28829 RepID=A0AAV6S720_SOLSE|nr:hypothetical protein JOB18_012542 [Solea senegalensis]